MKVTSVFFFLDIPKKQLTPEHVAACVTNQTRKKIFLEYFYHQQEISKKRHNEGELLSFLNTYCKLNLYISPSSCVGIQNFKILPQEFQIQKFPTCNKDHVFPGVREDLSFQERVCLKNMTFFKKLEEITKPYIENDNLSLAILNERHSNGNYIGLDSSYFNKKVPRLEIRIGKESKLKPSIR